MTTLLPVQMALVVAALLAMAMVGTAFGLGTWFGARLAARLMGREEPVFKDKPHMDFDDLDDDDLETT